ncbi:small ribosomal subunit protein mS35 isoform X3 [Narcine bancroftii]|uniref:small ribosomal subunit protein mS35 isoform X3 n=1 Tax=Narcine bancroftii TaxID=1343680 RepID=UPI0038320DCE
MAAGRAAGRGLVALTIVRRPIPPFRGIAFHSTTLSFTSPLPAKASINEPRTTLKEKQRREIPNFLHLTPPAIKNHCAALKDFCTVWPAALDNDEKCEEHFPIEITTTDYVAAGPSVRNPNARVVTLTIKILNLNLDDHAKKKLIKLVGNRYNKNTDILTITTDRCPLRQQNYDYALYLLTVLYHESWKTETWESDKTEADMDEFIWENSQSEKNALETIFRMKEAEKIPSIPREELVNSSEIKNYKKSVMNIKNEGETEDSILQYKECVKNLLKLKSVT